MKKIFVSILFLALQSNLNSFACTVCKSQQPKMLQGITHGVGPESFWDYFIILSSCLLVLITLAMSLKYLFKPKEANRNHVKYTILETK